jgi:hypothetical protein
MNPTNNMTELLAGQSSHEKYRPISTLQFATALAFISLPATVLFPIIAHREPDANGKSYTPTSTQAFETTRFNNTLKVGSKYYEIQGRLNSQPFWISLERYAGVKPK